MTGKKYFAHRGLFDNKKEYPENTMPAFQRAIERGYGIELDVHRTKDGRLVVIHDHVLTRLCKFNSEEDDHKLLRLKTCTIEELTYKEIEECTIYDSKERIPLFEDVLKLVSGRVPLIVEIKCEKYEEILPRQIADVLDRYTGEYCIESFHPMIVYWFRRHHPTVIRGQLATDYKKNKINHGVFQNFLLTTMLLNIATKPDFIAYNFKYASHPAFWFWTKIGKIPAYAWTIRSQKDLKEAEKNFQVFIFEGFEPKEEQ